MAPRARPPVGEPIEAKLPPEAALHVREGFAEAERGEFADMSKDETQHYVETGELPARVQSWLESSASRRAI